MALQYLETLRPMAGEEQLERLIEQARRRHAAEQAAQFPYAGAGLAVEREAQLGLETRGTQHAHGIFAITRGRVADELQPARGNVFDTARVVPDREVGDVVIERVGGEVTAPDVVVDGAVGVVAQDAA